MSDTRREALTRQALNPKTKQLDWEFVVRHERIQGILRKNNKADIYTVIYTLSAALREPDAIFEGLRFDDDEPRHCDNEGWLCYAYHPANRYNEYGAAYETPKNRIFLVFINDEKIVYNWAWEKADSNSLAIGRYLPVDYETRFDKAAYLKEQ